MSYKAPPNGFRTFLILWISQSVSVFGSGLTGFALNIWLAQSLYPLPEQKPQLAWALAAAGLCSGIAATVSGLLAGALTDRLDRKRIMLWSDLASGLLIGAAAVVMGLGLMNLWILLVGTTLATVLSVLHYSAFDTAYAMLVNDEQLPRANGMMQTIFALSSLLSPAMAATMIALPTLARQGKIAWPFLANIQEGAALALGVDAISFLFAATVLGFLTIPSPKQHAETRRASLIQDVGFGMQYIWRRRPLFWLLATFAVVNLCGMSLSVFTPLILKNDLLADWSARGYTFETAMAVISTTFAVGGVTGGVAISLWGGFKRRRYIFLLLGIAGSSLAQVAFGLSPTLYLAAGAALCMALLGPMTNAHSQAIWQSQVPRELQGRVFAVRRVLAQGLGPVSLLLAGWMAGVMEAGLGVALLGAIAAAVVTLQVFNPQIQRVEDTEYLERLAGD